MSLIASKIQEFLKGTGNTLSSKRLAFIYCVVFVPIGTIILCYKFVSLNQGHFAIQIWDSFLLLCSVLGGFVTSERFVKKENKEENIK
jgi:hypothetical protein